MAKAKVFYTIRNCGDGSAAVDFFGDMEAAELACKIEDEGEPFCDNDVRTETLDVDAGKASLYYTLHNNGDGSASARFHATEEEAQAACDEEEESGEPFSENYPNHAELKFDESGKLLNPTRTKEEMEKELAEILERRAHLAALRKPSPPTPKF